MKLSHMNQEGRAYMVDVSDKAVTKRIAKAQATIHMKPQTLKRILDGGIHKGDVLAVAQVAGVQAAKSTHHLIPMCHPLQLTHVNLAFSQSLKHSTLTLTSTVATDGKTGVEMEALTAVSVAALTVYDMCKSIDQSMCIRNILLLEKSGGKQGNFKYHNQEEINHG